MALSVQALLGREELGIAQVLQVVHDRDTRHAGAPEVCHRERAEQKVRPQIVGDLRSRAPAPEPSVGALDADARLGGQHRVDELPRDHRRLGPFADTLSLDIGGIERGQLGVAVVGRQQRVVRVGVKRAQVFDQRGGHQPCPAVAAVRLQRRHVDDDVAPESGDLGHRT